MLRSASFALLFVALSLGSSRAEASGPADSRQEMASWLSQQLHRPVDVSQLLSAPPGISLEGCVITDVHATNTGATSLRLRCATQPLPQLVLLHLSVDAARIAVKPRHTPSVPPTVRAGSTLQADWLTPSLHARLPVVAIESGSTGGEIRVRVKNTNRIMHARILSAHTVSILSAGV